jgi:hypothetical protein
MLAASQRKAPVPVSLTTRVRHKHPIQCLIKHGFWWAGACRRSIWRRNGCEWQDAMSESADKGRLFFEERFFDEAVVLGMTSRRLA